MNVLDIAQITNGMKDDWMAIVFLFGDWWYGYIAKDTDGLKNGCVAPTFQCGDWL